MLSAKRAAEILQKQFRQLDISIAESFSRLKRDLESQVNTIKALETKIAGNEKMIARLIKSSAAQKSSSPQKQPIRSKSSRLSPLHYDILKRLMIIQMESNRRIISMKELAEDLYPQKSYDIIKATLSEYITRLHKQGLVEKIHAGKLFLSYTDKALQYADDQRIGRMRSLISIPAEKKLLGNR